MGPGKMNMRVVVGFNPLILNGLSHHYHLGESTVIFRGVIFKFYYIF